MARTMPRAPHRIVSGDASGDAQRIANRSLWARNALRALGNTATQAPIDG
jgi:hypothetical protein